MKALRSLITMFAFIAVSGCTAMHTLAQGGASTASAVDNTAPLQTGTYFIVNAGGKALTPLSPTAGQNVFIQQFTKSGLQKWDVTRVVNGKNVTYYIKCAGSDAMYFRPHDMHERTAILGVGKGSAGFKITAAGTAKSWYIKSIFYNGDAMRSFVFSPELATELRFEAAEETDKFLWKFIPAASAE